MASKQFVHVSLIKNQAKKGTITHDLMPLLFRLIVQFCCQISNDKLLKPILLVSVLTSSLSHPPPLAL